jgi:heptosyltransferase-2
VVTTRAAAPLVETQPAVRRVIAYDKRGADRGWRGFFRLGRELRRTQYGRVFLPHQSWRSAALALAVGAPERIGFASSPAAMTYTRRVARPATGSEAWRLLALAETGEQPAWPNPWLVLTDADRARATAWLREHQVDAPFVALAPGSIWGTKRWPGFAGLAERLAMPVVIVGSGDDVELGCRIVSHAPAGSANAAGALTLRESAAIIERAAALVTNDSAPLHLATAMGTRIVALFGPTIPAFGFGPLRGGDLVVEHTDLACRPCSRHGPPVCPLGHHRCMNELTVERVAAALDTVLNASEGRRALHRRD